MSKTERQCAQMNLQQIHSKPLIDCPTTNLGPLFREQPHSNDVNHCIYLFQPKDPGERHNKVGSLSLAKQLVGLKPETF